MADWNAYEARIRDRALADAANAARVWSRTAAEAIEQLRTASAQPAVADGTPPVVKGGASFPARGGGAPLRYPFRTMEIGDTFDVPRNLGRTDGGTCRRQNAVVQAAKAWAKRYNPTAKFETRLIDANTVRCKRTA